jgi:hypothetical protein
MSNLRLIPRSPSIHFEDRTLYFSNIEGQWWIALKPICDALGLRWSDQHDDLKRDPILAELYAEQRMVAADGKARKMVCLPERWIYGWLFRLSSKNPKLLAFQRQCYHVLFDYFHDIGETRKANALEIARAKRERQKLKVELSANESFKRYQDLNNFINGKFKEQKRADRLLEEEQLLLFAED